MQFKHINNDFKLRTKRKKQYLPYVFTNYHKNIFFNFAHQQKLLNNKIFICKSKIKNICLTTALQRSTNISKFRVSRHRFKKYATKNFYPGLRKASW